MGSIQTPTDLQGLGLENSETKENDQDTSPKACPGHRLRRSEHREATTRRVTRDDHDSTVSTEECGEYYDLRKTLPRFYRLFEHLNKGA